MEVNLYFIISWFWSFCVIFRSFSSNRNVIKIGKNFKNHFSCLEGCNHAYHVGEDRTYIYHGATAPSVPRPPHYRGFMNTLRHTTTFSRTPLDEWSVPRRDLYQITHNNHNRQTSMLPAVFEPTIPASERPQTHALDRAATGIGDDRTWQVKLSSVTLLKLWCC